MGLISYSNGQGKAEMERRDGEQKFSVPTSYVCPIVEGEGDQDVESSIFSLSLCVWRVQSFIYSREREKQKRLEMTRRGTGGDFMKRNKKMSWM